MHHVVRFHKVAVTDKGKRLLLKANFGLGYKSSL